MPRLLIVLLLLVSGAVGALGGWLMLSFDPSLHPVPPEFASPPSLIATPPHGARPHAWVLNTFHEARRDGVLLLLASIVLVLPAFPGVIRDPDRPHWTT